MKLLSTLLCFALLSPLAHSHEGDLDLFGGHYVWDESETFQIGYHLHRDYRATDDGELSELNKLSRKLQKQKKYEDAAMVRYLMDDIEASMKYFRWAERQSKSRRFIIEAKRAAVQAMVEENG